MATPSVSEFTPKFTFACYWHLMYSQEEVKHVGSCTVGERGDAYEAAFASQVCRKPKYVKVSAGTFVVELVNGILCLQNSPYLSYGTLFRAPLLQLSGNVRSISDGRPKKASLTIALRENTPSTVKIDVAKDFAQFEKFVSLLKQLRATDKGATTKHVRWKYRLLPWYIHV